MPDSLRINGNLTSWGSAKLLIDGDPYFGVTEIAYGDKRERVKGYGIGAHQGPRGRSRGKYTTDEGKLTMYRASAQAFLDALVLRGVAGISFGDTIFTAVVQTVEPGEQPLTVTLDRCVVVGVTETNSEGPDPLMTEITFDYMAIFRNRKTLFDPTRGLP